MSPLWRQRLTGGLVLAAVIALAWLAYGGCLSYSFMLDDPMDLPRSAGHSVWFLATSSADYGYYRPLTSIAWLAMFNILGRHDPFWLHLLPLSLHIANGYLVYILFRHFTEGEVAAAAALLFTLYPFSFQAVPMVNVTFHVLGAFLTLLAAALYIKARATGSWRWLAPSLVGAFLAPFAHESAVMVGPLVVAIEAFQGRTRNRSRLPLAYLAFGVVFALIWVVVPKLRDEPFIISADSMARSIPHLLQGMLYPLAGSLGSLEGTLSPDIALKALIVVVLPLLALAYWRGKRFSLFLLSLAWFTLGVLPSWLMLDYLYILDSPRLLYLASPGACLLWAGLLGLRIPRWLPRHVWRGAAVLLLALVAYQSLAFIEKRNILYDMGSDLVYQIVDTGSQGPGNALYVNVPAWVAYKEIDYPSGHSGAIMIPGYVGLGRVIYVHRGREPLLESVAYADLLRPWGYWYGPHGPTVGPRELDAAIREADTVFVTEFLPLGWRVREAGSVRETPVESLPQRPLASFGDTFILESATASIEDGEVSIALRWACRKADAADLTIFAHLLTGDGSIVGQADGYALRGTSPLNMWRPGDRIIDLRTVAMPQVQGDYTILVGIYDRSSGQRIPTFDADGQRLPNDAISVGVARTP